MSHETVLNGTLFGIAVFANEIPRRYISALQMHFPLAFNALLKLKKTTMNKFIHFIYLYAHTTRVVRP